MERELNFRCGIQFRLLQFSVSHCRVEGSIIISSRLRQSIVSAESSNGALLTGDYVSF